LVVEARLAAIRRDAMKSATGSLALFPFVEGKLIKRMELFRIRMV
jgi:hypothetical protein